MTGDLRWGVLMSLAIHLLILMLGTWLVVDAPQLGMPTGEVQISVNLVGDSSLLGEAAALSPMTPQQSINTTEATEEPVTVDSVATQTAASGSGTVAPSGPGGAVTKASPLYLENPAPAYPERARRLGQEGTVLLTVRVGVTGQALQVALKKSSGHPSLDEAATRSVRQWRFKPADLSGVPVEATVEVPIRFKLQ